MEKPAFHPCPGTASQKAWMNIILDEGQGYDKPVAVLLYQRDLHNLIAWLTSKLKEYEGKGEAPLIAQDLAERLDRAWQHSLEG